PAVHGPAHDLRDFLGEAAYPPLRRRGVAFSISYEFSKEPRGGLMNFITKKHIPRRTFLRGAGVTVALPLLEAMLPAQTPLKATAANPATRFVGIWHPHGAAPGWWHPKGAGKNFEFSFITQPLEPVRDHVLFVS